MFVYVVLVLSGVCLFCAFVGLLDDMVVCLV